MLDQTTHKNGKNVTKEMAPVLIVAAVEVAPIVLEAAVSFLAFAAAYIFIAEGPQEPRVYTPSHPKGRKPEEVSYNELEPVVGRETWAGTGFIMRDGNGEQYEMKFPSDFVYMSLLLQVRLHPRLRIRPTTPLLVLRGCCRHALVRACLVRPAAMHGLRSGHGCRLVRCSHRRRPPQGVHDDAKRRRFGLVLLHKAALQR